MNLLRRMRNWPLAYKLFASFSILFALAGAFGGVIVYSLVSDAVKDSVESELKNSTSIVLSMVKTSAGVSIKNHLRAVAERNREIAHYFYKQYEAGVMSEEQAKEGARAVFLNQTIGKTGYVFVWDIREAPRKIPLAVHPKIQGVDVAGVDFVQRGAALKSGYMEYQWKNPGEKEERAKSMYLAWFEPWDWVIAASSYRDEFKELVDVDDFRANILSLRFGHSGYAYVIDSGGHVVIHPDSSGMAGEMTDERGAQILKEISGRKTGRLVYAWKGPNDDLLREKICYFDYIPEYDWIVVSSGYTDELYASIDAVRFTTGIIFFMTLLLVLSVSYRLSSSITGPLQELTRNFALGAKGDFSVRMDYKCLDEVGYLATYFNVFMDSLEAEIRERREAEDALRGSEEKYRKLVETASDAIFLIDVESGIIVEVNKKAEELLDLGADQIVGMHHSRLFPGDGAGEPSLIPSIHGSNGKAVYTDISVRRPDGSKIPVEVSTAVAVIGGKRLLQGIFRDITERKRSERERARLAAVVEQMAEAVVIADTDGVMQYVNPAFIRVTGYSREDVLGRSVGILRSGGQGEDFYRGLREALARGDVWTGRLTSLKKDGSRYEEEMTLSPVRDATGETSSYVAVKRDVTHEIELERQLRSAQKMEALGTLAGGIAHDFNNILAAIMGYTEMTLHQVSGDTRLRRNLDQVLKACQRASDLVKQILAFSRQSEAERKPVEVAPIVKEALKLLRASLASSIRIREAIDPEAGVILADPTQIHQVLMNLCANAAYAMREKGGVLDVRLRREVVSAGSAGGYPGLAEGAYVQLTVRDNGHGMDMATLERIFDPYFTTKEKGVGTGLGLAAVHGIVKRNGGAVSVESVPGSGSSFQVHLPAVDRAPVSPKVGPASLPGGTESVLLVDDEPALVDVGKGLLEHLGYEVVSTSSPRQAIEIFRAAPHRFHVVITDMTMPQMTGVELAREMLGIRPEIPIILCTGYSEVISEGTAKAMGIKEFVLKPIVFRELAATIRSVIDET